ncbi:hypothetical protein K503DRAFT_188109 [Rhizopogon vinicolor AM-OR11-026]|uniref:Uncharacterized protein n=1 Tax=Rhizopogon vinicolor AM-OR11-026 TaxID=1314800 RepID=A0A1B7MZK3_9AGAM|nr:hypothetical protein K503DRAFT_188109 [Rhizopogon vinicolor AM-OR11-026]
MRLATQMKMSWQRLQKMESGMRGTTTTRSSWLIRLGIDSHDVGQMIQPFTYGDTRRQRGHGKKAAFMCELRVNPLLVRGCQQVQVTHGRKLDHTYTTHTSVKCYVHQGYNTFSTFLQGTIFSRSTSLERGWIIVRKNFTDTRVLTRSPESQWSARINPSVVQITSLWHLAAPFLPVNNIMATPEPQVLDAWRRPKAGVLMSEADFRSYFPFS